MRAVQTAESQGEEGQWWQGLLQETGLGIFCFQGLDWTLFSLLLPLPFTDKMHVVMFLVGFTVLFLYCTTQLSRSINLLNWLTVLVTTPFWTLTRLSIALHNYAVGSRDYEQERNQELVNWGSNTRSVCSVLAAFIIISPVTLLVWCDISMLLLLMCWQTLESGWEGRRCHIQFWQGVLWRRATVWCLEIPWCAHCFRFCFFLFHSRFVLQDSQSCFLSLHTYHN